MKKLYISLIFIYIFFGMLNAQNIKNMEFQNQDITDILLVLAESSGTSIIPDETVTGKASFYFSESSIETALDTFLTTYKLYYEKNDNFITVSKIKLSYDNNTKTASISASDVPLDSIFRKLSTKIGKTILFDTLPSSLISIDISNLSIEEILNICIRKLPDYSVETTDTYFYVKKSTSKSPNHTKTKIDDMLIKDGNLYTLSLEKARFLEILTKLFTLEGVEYSLFLQADKQIENLYFYNKDFDTLLNLLLEQGNADCVEKNGIFYVIELQKKGISNKLKKTEIIPLKWIQVQDITSLIPSELLTNSSLKIDKQSNTILITGIDDEITPILQFIKQIDTPQGGLIYEKIDIKYLEAKDVITLIPPKLVQNTPVQIPNTNSFLAFGTKESIDGLKNFISTIDTKKSGTPIKLKYIQTETLLKNLPPSITKESIVDSGFPNLVFYKGSEENKKLFMYELSLIDKPQPQIKYQLLVIQYIKNNSSSVSPSLSVNAVNDNSNFVFGGELSNILGLSFDIISNFGYKFAIGLDAKISDNIANIYTDTTLTALSGQDIKFQNTDTSRYIETYYDTSGSSTTKTSVTQSITSGLIVSLNGWVSGDNMITMTVNATVSKQNNSSNTSASSGVTSLPSTSERIVTTQVRTMSGEPVVISGLIKEDENNTKTRIPFLGKIPLLKHIFSQSAKTKEKTEIVIYIVPHLVQDPETENNEELNIERYYRTFMD